PPNGPAQTEAEASLARQLVADMDFAVLARRLPLLSDDLLERLRPTPSNSHHGFRPDSTGPAPYRKPEERGRLLTRATSHDVTPELDGGPIIEQDVARVTRAMTAADLQARGAYVEREVLSRAVQWHAEDRVIRHGNHTIVF